MDEREAVRRYCRCGARIARDNDSDMCTPCLRRAYDRVLGAPTVPPEFWTASPQLADALAARHMGQVIAAYRLHPFHQPPLSQGIVAGWMNLSQAQTSRIETGPHIHDLSKLIRWARALCIPEELLWFKLPGSSGPPPSGLTKVVPAEPAPRSDPLDSLDHLRQSAIDNLTSGALSGAALDDWEHTVYVHGRATRYLPPILHLVDLASDFADVMQVLSRRQPATATRRLTRVTAQLAGLISLTLIKLGHRSAARDWGRTARLAAAETADPAISSWVRAQDAYTAFYTGDPGRAAAIAAEAQALAGRTPCVGAVLAAAAEARAYAVLGQEAEAGAALVRAETGLAALGPDDITASAFGYNEAQLRFHAGNAYTHLGDTTRAAEAQGRALALYPASDYLDRTLIQLDQADCLLHAGDIPAGAAHAVAAILALPNDHRDGLILGRARQLTRSLGPRGRTLPDVRALRDLLELPAGSVGDGA
ncbi:hypothetical protein [Frankia sp. Cr2]|uniref:hypothetical protein n=1 Tax=Frankia sp. Cr2 TaxID=3073932 RepID=UPI002AD492CB|nr:hypothetical protein [Frankia sp. Cr2]